MKENETDFDNLAPLADLVGQLYPAVYQLFHISRHTLPGQEITPRMAGVLHHLAASGPLTLKELGDHLGLGKATVCELMDRLEEKNWWTGLGMRGTNAGCSCGSPTRGRPWPPASPRSCKTKNWKMRCIGWIGKNENVWSGGSQPW